MVYNFREKVVQTDEQTSETRDKLQTNEEKSHQVYINEELDPSVPRDRQWAE